MLSGDRAHACLVTHQDAQRGHLVPSSAQGTHTE